MADLLTHVVAGSGPPLVLLNGGLMSMRAWDAVAAPLEQECAVIRCDLRGQLMSPGTPPPTLGGHATDIVGLLDHLGVARAHLAGTSFGALVGLTMAAMFPRRVSSLVAMTATDRMTDDMKLAAQAMRNACREAAQGGDGGAVFDLVAPGTFSPAFRERFARELAERRAVVASLPRAWFVALDSLMAAVEDLDFQAVLPRVACPVLVLAAGEDRTFPLPHSRALSEALARARLQIVEGAAHGMVVENPRVVTQAILSFVHEVEEDADRSTAPRGESRA